MRKSGEKKGSGSGPGSDLSCAAFSKGQGSTKVRRMPQELAGDLRFPKQLEEHTRIFIDVYILLRACQ